ncbi:hypothetical protein L1049_006807 [Liquidambar formosana]|uniref:F-box domain-containing protein n=1 Tax=Liquidambar formosana TaxID=63359 RepID=A0AAP0WUP1_LIQFO
MDMEILHAAKNKEDEIITHSMQIVSILPSLDPHRSSQEEYSVKEEEPGPPHEALFLVLAYLPLFELLAMSELCRSLKDAVNKDVLLWLDIIVERPLNLRISDEILVKIASRANGRLRNLALMNCVRITDDGLLKVVEKNPLINKLYVPACTGLTPEGIIRAVKTLTEQYHNLKSLKINGIYNIEKEHLEMLRYCFQKNPELQEKQKQQPSLFIDYGNCSAFEERSCSIDMDICPKCSEVRIVLDCPRETCEKKRERPLTECRGCSICIPRCEECGGCVELEELEETVCADILCLDCWLQLPKCNFCNQPYCKRHANQQCTAPDSIGWVCGVCHAKFVHKFGCD